MKHLTKHLITISIVIVVVVLFFYVKYTTPKVAYIRSADLIYGYKGMQSAQMEFETKSKRLQNNLDTLKFDFERERIRFKNEHDQLSASEKEERIKRLQQLEDNINVYSTAIEKQFGEDEMQLTKGVLNQINGFIETYSKEHGFDLVLGSGGNGTVLWGDKAYDITDDLLNELNKNHQLSPSITDTSGKSNTQ